MKVVCIDASAPLLPEHRSVPPLVKDEVYTVVNQREHGQWGTVYYLAEAQAFQDKHNVGYRAARFVPLNYWKKEFATADERSHELQT